MLVIVQCMASVFNYQHEVCQSLTHVNVEIYAFSFSDVGMPCTIKKKSRTPRLEPTSNKGTENWSRNCATPVPRTTNQIFFQILVYDWMNLSNDPNYLAPTPRTNQILSFPELRSGGLSQRFEQRSGSDPLIPDP